MLFGTSLPVCQISENKENDVWGMKSKKKKGKRQVRRETRIVAPLGEQTNGHFCTVHALVDKTPSKIITSINVNDLIVRVKRTTTINELKGNIHYINGREVELSHLPRYLHNLYDIPMVIKCPIINREFFSYIYVHCTCHKKPFILP